MVVVQVSHNPLPPLIGIFDPNQQYSIAGQNCILPLSNFLAFDSLIFIVTDRI